MSLRKGIPVPSAGHAPSKDRLAALRASLLQAGTDFIKAVRGNESGENPLFATGWQTGGPSETQTWLRQQRAQVAEAFDEILQRIVVDVKSRPEGGSRRQTASELLAVVNKSIDRYQLTFRDKIDRKLNLAGDPKRLDVHVDLTPLYRAFGDCLKTPWREASPTAAR